MVVEVVASAEVIDVSAVEAMEDKI